MEYLTSLVDDKPQMVDEGDPWEISSTRRKGGFYSYTGSDTGSLWEFLT